MKNSPALKSILQAIRNMKLLFSVLVLVVAGAIIAALLPPLVLEKVVNELSAGGQVSIWLAVSYFALLALSGLLTSAREALLTVFGQKITHHLRSDLCNKLIRLPADTFVRTEPGVTVSRFVGDVDTIENLFTSGIISMFADACQMISIFVILFLKNTGLALLLLFLLPIVAIFTRTVQQRTLKAQKDNRAAVGAASGHVPETIRCIRTIHTLWAEEYMKEQYERSLQDSFAAVEKTNFYDSVYSPTILILNALITAFVMILAATGNVHIQSFFGMSVGTAVAVISYISQVFSPIQSIGMEIQAIQSAAAGLHRVDEFLLQEEREIPEIDRLADRAAVQEMESVPPDMNASGNCIELKNVTFSYSTGKTVLKDLSLIVKPGERLTITGRTGAGKSTIFKLLLGLYSPSSGEALVEGRRADIIPDSEKRHIFGYVEQSFYLVPGTVRDQICLFDEEISEEMMRSAACTAGIEEAILALPEGYDTPCSAGIFSQGQWQLLSIARAIAAEPRILLLDEITANLDSDTEQLVLAALQKASANRTVLSISHRLYESMGGREFLCESPCK